MDTVPLEPTFVDGNLFLGRVEEQKQFRHALREVLDAPAEEMLPYIILLYGDGGIGKTTLSRRFWQITHEEEPFAGAFRGLWLDWEDLRRRTPALQGAREQVSPETVLDLLYKTAVNEWGDKAFKLYPQAVQDRAAAETAAAKALTIEGERDELAAQISGLATTALAKLVRLSLPVGEGGEAVTKALLDAGVELGASRAAKLRAALTERLQHKLKPEQFRLFLSPHEHLAQALGHDLKGLAQGWLRKPLVMVLDTYEIVDRTDVWLRQVMKAAGPKVVWVVSGRDNLADSRFFGGANFTGYRTDFPRRLQAYNLGELALADLQAYFAHMVPERPLSETEAAALTQATRGIPLAIREAAAIWHAGLPLAKIVGEESGRVSHEQIVERMTERYLRYALESEADRVALYALALAEGDIDQLQAMLQPDGNASFDLEARLAQLARGYASVHLQAARLHDAATQFIQAYLRVPLRRQGHMVHRLNKRRTAVLRTRLDKFGSSLLLEERCDDEDWQQAALALTRALFWVDEDQAWRWLIPGYVAGLAYSRDLRRSLVQAAQPWREVGNAAGRKRLKLLQAAEDSLPDAADEATLLHELHRLARAGWLVGEDEAEQRAILAWRQGALFLRQKQYPQALAALGQAEGSLPPEGTRLQEQLAETMYELSGELLWPQGQGKAVYAAEAERLLPKVVQWLPEKQGAWYRLGVALKQANRYEAAIAAYQQAIALDAKDAYPHHGLGNVYRDQGQYEAAIAAYQQAIALDAKLASPHNGLGNVYRDQGQYEAAIAAYQQAIALDAKFAYPHNGLGNVYSDQGQYEAAIAAYQQAIALDAKYAFPHNGLGNVYSAQGQYEAAIAAYQQAIALDAKLAYPHNGLGTVYRAQGQYEAAIAAYQQAIALDAKLAFPHHGLGTVYSDQGQYEAAIAAYQQAIALDAKFASPHNGLGNVYRAQGQYEAAIAAYQQAIALDAKFAYPHTGLGNVYRAQGQYEAAIAAYQQAIALDAKDAYPHNGLGTVYSDQGQYEAAIAAYQQAIALDAKYASPHNGLGNVYRAQGQYEAAIAAYQQAIALDAKYAFPHNGLGTVYSAQGQYEAAIAAYQQAIALDAKLAYPHNGLGTVYSAQGQYEAAIAAYQQAIALDAKLAFPHNGLGTVYSDQGQYEAAIAAYQQAIALDAKLAFPHNGLGNVYRDQGQYEAAIAAYQQAIALDAKLAFPHNNLAESYMNLSRFAEAEYHFQERVRLEPHTALSALVSLGILARHQGRRAESDNYFRQALSVWDGAWQVRYQTPLGLLENKAVALLGLGQQTEALAVLQAGLAQKLPGDVIERGRYDLLLAAPEPPAGVAEMLAAIGL